MANSRFKIVGDEFQTPIDYYDEFHVNLLFDRSIYRPMCTHMVNQFLRTTVFHRKTSNQYNLSSGV